MISSSRSTQWSIAILVGLLYCCAPSTSWSQVPTIAHVQPDMGAPGMTIALEILAPADLPNSFGNDGIAPPGLSIRLVDPADTLRVMFGIPVVSWKGRMIQVPLFIRRSALFDFDSAGFGFQVVKGTAISNVGRFFIGRPQGPIKIIGSVAIGDGSLGRRLSKGNTMIVDSIDISGELSNHGIIEIDRRDPDENTPGNPRLLPVTILSAGPIRFSNVDVHIEGRGKNGGPGGGGGGSGNQGTGGEGYTGGGSSTATSDSNIGSASGPTVDNGGSSPTRVKGGRSDQGDQGGGGGTGHPFGKSCEPGQPNFNSAPGGYGGGSAGGELPELHYGGGGGGFGEKASPGGGVGDNAGNRTGGRLLIPLAGGSGGGAGNSVDEEVFPAGSGGGGGGSLALISFDEMVLLNTNIIAHGDSGTTGVDNTGSGGGGSGGSFVAASNTLLKVDHLNINVAGGIGGVGSANGLPGGDGSIGISRIDGLDSNISSSFPAKTHQSSLSQKRLPKQLGTSIEVGGIAGSGDAFTDSIRIYYRNYHSAWMRVDTVSFGLNGKRYWKKTIPALNDSTLFVSAFQKINDPRNTEYDHDPQWISTHVSHQIVKSQSKPQLVIVDTIRFPNTKIGRCIDSNVLLKNLGEALLSISSANVSQPFSIADLPLEIKGYGDSVIKLSFCPTKVGCIDTVIVLHTNAGERSLRLIGCGVQTDERVHLDPTLLIFDDTKVGQCDTGTVTIRSLGADPTSIRFNTLFPPPFSIDTLGKKTTLKQGEFETFTVTFCPEDSGLFRDTVTVIGPEAKFAVQGKGIRRIVVKRDTVFDGSLCLNYATIVEDTIYNRGNDVVRIDSVTTSSSQVQLLSSPLANILPGEKHVYQFKLEPSGVGSRTDLAQYKFGSDLIAVARFVYTTNERIVAASIPDFYSCADTIQDQQLLIVNDGSRSVTISVENFDSKFAPLGATTFLLSKGSRTLDIRFDPNVEVGEFTDTIDLVVTTEGCGDTTLKVVLHGFGTSEQLVFSKRVLDFGEVIEGDCVSDSIFVTNVCGPDATITPEQLPASNVFSSTLLEAKTLKTGEGIWVVYRFCPKLAGLDSIVHRITIEQPKAIIDIHLRGTGIRKPDELRTFLRLTDAVIALGSEGQTSLILDSVRPIANITKLTAEIRYDPSLVRLVSIEPIGQVVAAITTDPAAGKIAISLTGTLSGELLRFSWLGLLGPDASTEIKLVSVSSEPVSIPSSVDGHIDLVDCFGLAGQVVPPQVAVSVIRPQPVEGVLKLFVQAQHDLPGEFIIRDAAGRAVMSSPATLREGLHAVQLPVSGLPAGMYWVELTAGGIIHSQRFWK